MEREKIEIPCPSCGRQIKTTLYEMYSRREAKCSYCGTKYIFNPSEANKLRSSINALEKAKSTFNDAFEKMIETADRLLKKK